MFRYINGIPVWGEPDDATLEQIQRCAGDEPVAGAALMADAHKGYSMPIGGVVAYRDAISPSGVGYDIACIAAGTPVTTRDGYYVPIEQVTESHPITCWDGSRVRLVDPNIGALQRGTRPTLTITLANGCKLRVTTDHHILTSMGWKEAQALTLLDLVVVHPFIGLPYEERSEVLPLSIDNPIWREELTKRGLYPLHTDSPLFPVILRLLAYISGDGSLSSDGKRMTLSTTSEIDAIDIVSDITRLGYAAAVYRRTRPSQPRATLHINVDSVALYALFIALGSTPGKKEWPADPMPWLFAMPAWVRGHFLSAFCSAERMTPGMLKNSRPHLQLKQSSAHQQRLDFMVRLLRSLNFDPSVTTSSQEQGTHLDALLQLTGSEATRFLQEVGFCYAHEKRVGAAQVMSMGRRRNPFVIYPTDNTTELYRVAITSIQPGDTLPVYDIVTDDPAHAFFASGIVVHNCGLKAVRTDVRTTDLRPKLSAVLDQIEQKVVFGVGGENKQPVDHELFDDPTWVDVPHLRGLKNLARQQLGTVGSGNHFVDLFTDQDGWVWVGVHFGSRGFGHKTASGFLNLATRRSFDASAPGESMDQPATVLPLRGKGGELGQAYLAAMQLAGRYAYAGRDYVVQQVLNILGANATYTVHNHHNFGWVEEHNGEKLVVVRKGATPAWPGQQSMVGGSMGDISVIIEGVESPRSQTSLYSTIHGAGRVMSRTAAAGRMRWRKGKNGQRVQEIIKPGQITREMMLAWLKREHVELRGGGPDESPHVYRRLPEVLAHHQDTIRILYTLQPLGVIMAGADIYDPYKD